jgi:hypothetical protein
MEARRGARTRHDATIARAVKSHRKGEPSAVEVSAKKDTSEGPTAPDSDASGIDAELNRWVAGFSIDRTQQGRVPGWLLTLWRDAGLTSTRANV